MADACAIRTATLVTSHVWESGRRAGFHWIADSLLRRGWKVNFVTGYSGYDYLKSDYRKCLVKSIGRNRPLEKTERLSLLANWPILRPIGFRLPLLNRITYPAAMLYRYAASRDLKKMVSESELIVMESTYEIMFTPELRKCAPHARFVYRVSDDLATRNTHPAAIAAEQNALKVFNLISLPGPVFLERFGNEPTASVQLHGIPTNLYLNNHYSPYRKNSTNAIFSGNNLLDQSVLLALSSKFSDVIFHIIGPFKDLVKAENVVYYGEMRYEDSIPFVVNADIGLNILEIPGFEESNKMQQYRFCRLPVVVNGLEYEVREDRYFYRNGDPESAILAFESALNRGMDIDLSHRIRSWDDLVSELIGESVGEQGR